MTGPEIHEKEKGVWILFLGAWLVGSDYLAYTELNFPPLILQKETSSEGYDPATCKVWVRDAKSGKLSAFAPKQQNEISAPSGEILSDWLGDAFLTLSPDKKSIEIRNTEGKVQKMVEAPWAVHAKRVIAGNNTRWALSGDENRLWLTHLDANYQLVKETPLATSRDFWGNSKILFNSKTNKLWVGFAETKPSHAYSPTVLRVDPDGKIEAKFEWNERGLFFDVCLDSESVLISRDMPSLPYTVPVYSTLEAIPEAGKASTYYQADANLFIDGMICETDRILMVQRSIFGSDGSYLVDWNRKSGSTGKQLFRLPSPIRKLYACP